MTKQVLRRIYKERRRELTPPEQAKLDDLLLIQFQTAELPFIQTLFSYWPIEANKEPNTHLFTGYLEFSNPGLQIAYPKTNLSIHEMTAIATTENTRFVKNEYGLEEPEAGPIVPVTEIDMVIVPLLAFDTHGYRVGYGKGYYDKFLSQCRPDCIKTGFSYFEPVAEIEDKHEFDVPLNLCITPQTVYVF
jgi:5-formyltetrahydrofolate cyclo-ligase